MGATEALIWAGFAVLNLSLAVLVGRVTPRRLANGLVAVLFAANGGASLVRVGAETGWYLDSGGSSLEYLFNLISLVPLVALPLVFPRRRLSPRGERALLLGAGLLLLPIWLVDRLYQATGFEPFLSIASSLQLLRAFDWLFFGAPLLGTLLLLDAYLSATSPIQRKQARFLLAAYGLKTSVIVATLALLPPATPGGPLDVYAFVAVEGSAPMISAAALVVLLAVPLALAAARVRIAFGRGMGEGPPFPWRGDALVLACLGLGLGLPLFGEAVELEYLLLRPVLLAYAVLHYQLLEVDLRRNRVPLAAALLAGTASLVALAIEGLQGLGVDPGVATGVGVVLIAGLIGGLAAPMLRALLGPSEPTGERDRNVYRAALEEALAAGPGHDASSESILRRLRARLNISDREHGIMELETRAAGGQPGASPRAGERYLGRYRVERLLGEGGFAHTFLAHDEQLQRRVVLKVTRTASLPEARRMLREARLVARLGHPAIVGVHDVEQVGDACILVLEYVEGGSLAERLARGRLPVGQALAVADDVLAALEAAHAKGLVHRDIKPANILLTREGRAKLADFGVARDVQGSGTASGLSLDGRTPGTLRYMAPEQVRSATADARSDLFALGVVLYEMLAGRPYLEFEGRAEFEAQRAILEEEPDLPLPGVPREVNALLAQALAKDPAQRPASAAAMRRRLAEAVASAGEGAARDAS